LRWIPVRNTADRALPALVINSGYRISSKALGSFIGLGTLVCNLLITKAAKEDTLRELETV